MLKVGIAGLGAISGTHLEVIRRKPAEAELTAVCDCDCNKQIKVKGVPFYVDLEEMLQNEKLDCLHICLPHYLHVLAIRLAAQYGVAVFVEKPVGISVAEIDTLLSDENVKRAKVGVCLQNRYNATTKKMLEIIADGMYGRLKGCKAVVTWNRQMDYYTREPWRGILKQAGGGVMLSQAIHTIDLMEVFCGIPLWVKGMVGNLVFDEIEVEDTACAYISFENNIQGIFYATVAHCNNSSIELELVMEHGVFCIRNNQLILLKNHEEIILARDCIVSGEKEYYGSGHDEAIYEFYRELQGNGGSHININDARNVNLLIERIMESSATGNKVCVKEGNEK